MTAEGALDVAHVAHIGAELPAIFRPSPVLPGCPCAALPIGAGRRGQQVLVALEAAGWRAQTPYAQHYRGFIRRSPRGRDDGTTNLGADQGDAALLCGVVSSLDRSRAPGQT